MGTKKDIGERRLRNKENGISERGDQTWIDRECAECHFKDVRLQKRFGILLEQMSGGIGESIPFVCQDWANTKAAYRFLSNRSVSEEEILRGHFQSTRERLALESGPILILHDTTEFSYQKRTQRVSDFFTILLQGNTRTDVLVIIRYAGFSCIRVWRLPLRDCPWD